MGRRAAHLDYAVLDTCFIVKIFLGNVQHTHNEMCIRDSTTALLLLLGGMILVVLGIMGEYVGRIYMCSSQPRGAVSPAYVPLQAG